MSADAADMRSGSAEESSSGRRGHGNEFVA